jgi:hypothetical protein
MPETMRRSWIARGSERSILPAAVLLAAVICCGCSHGVSTQQTADVVSQASPAFRASGPPAGGSAAENGVYRGFDRNDYPGDETMAAMQASFAFTGYWLTNPPGENANTWVGKRALLRAQGWGFLVLANGRLDAEILKAQKQGTTPAQLARKDAAQAIAAAHAEGFPPHTILYLDQEEGGLLLDEQAAYLLAWTEAVAASGMRAGVYASGQPVPNGPGQTITTVNDIRSRVTSGHLHPVSFFDAQDACPPAPGCTMHPKPLSASGEPVLNAGGNLIAWQYAQSPGRKDITLACRTTYAKDGNCYAPGFGSVFLDLDAAASADPSDGR